jgi:broad specificity phosphatase PhoE
MEGVQLTSHGHLQAEALSQQVCRLHPDIIYSSPRQRTRQTADYLAACSSLNVHINSEFEECDFGSWTGLSFKQLDAIPEWKDFNSFRSVHTAPGGESIYDVQRRATKEILRLHALHPGKRVAVVTHGDVIRSALMFFLGMPLDMMFRFTVEPASLSVIDLHATHSVVRAVNHTIID